MCVWLICVSSGVDELGPGPVWLTVDVSVCQVELMSQAQAQAQYDWQLMYLCVMQAAGLQQLESCSQWLPVWPRNTAALVSCSSPALCVCLCLYWTQEHLFLSYNSPTCFLYLLVCHWCWILLSLQGRLCFCLVLVCLLICLRDWLTDWETDQLSNDSVTGSQLQFSNHAVWPAT